MPIAVYRHLAQDVQEYKGYDMQKGRLLVKRYLVPPAAFLLGSSLMAGVYIGILARAQGWEYASGQFILNRWYIVPIYISFGVQAALYSILRFRLFISNPTAHHTGTIMGTSGGASVTAMVACCLHHITDVMPILGLSAAATFLVRYQRPAMLASLGLNILGIIAMLAILHRERRRLQPAQKLQVVLEPE